ncbi:MULTISPECIES: oxidoreductase [Gracilibacillus]|uniref:oxidoreductase n=1 Tax=Gracilibacillus TaxID=74385 RepID=UPI000825BEDA|nr:MULTISPECIES: oxidoreductase [Gracilibacillus]
MSRFAVIGPGAVGAVIGESLQKAGYAVTLLGKQPGKVQVHHNDNTSTTLPVAPLSETTTTFDYVFITVKGTQLETILPYLDQVLHRQTICILCQNGYGQLERFPLPHTYQAVVYISGQKKGQVITHFRDRTLILPENSATYGLKEAVSKSNLDIQLHRDYLHDIWYKLLVNLAINSVTALSQNTAVILQDRKIRTICEELLKEGISIAAAEGIDFKPTIVNEIMTIYDGYPPHMGTSMYYDRIHQQPMETDYIQGYLYLKSRTHALHTPYLDTVYSLLVASEISK